MAAFKITVDDKRILIAGDVIFTTVPDLAKALDKLISEQADITIRFVAIESCDSSALALMLHCYRFAKNRHITLQFEAIPASLLAVANLCGISDLLPQTVSVKS